MRIAVLLGVLCILFAGAWLALDRVALDLGRSQLEAFGFADLVDFEWLEVREAERRIVVHGARLLDPATNQPVAHVPLVEVQLALPSWGSEEPPRVTEVRGRGGRALLSFADDELVLAQVISELVDRIVALLPEDAEPSHGMPPLVFEDIEGLLVGAGWPVQRLRGLSVDIRDAGPQYEVAIDTPEGGRVWLAIDGEGVRRIEVSALPVQPVASQFAPDLDAFLGRELRVRGVIDLSVEVDGEEAVVEGVLRQAFLHPRSLTFPLGPATVPFHYEDGRMRLDRARVAFEGGSAILSAEGEPDDFVVQLDVEPAVFQERLMQFVPAYKEFGFVHTEGGGRFELHLEIPVRDEEMVLEGMRGYGGHMIERVLIDPPGLLLEDLVGRLEIEGSVLRGVEVQARCAGGGLVGSGELDMLSEEFRLRFAVEDVDLARLRLDELLDLDPRGRDVEGWLQAELRLRGRVFEPSSLRGRGQFSIRAADLWETRFLEALLLALPAAGEPGGRQGVSSDFRVADEAVELRDVVLRSDLFTLVGETRVGFGGDLSGELRIQVPLGPFGRLVEFFQQRFLVNLVVGGTLEEPKVVARPLDVVTGPLSRLWDALVGRDEPPAPEPAPDPALETAEEPVVGEG